MCLESESKSNQVGGVVWRRKDAVAEEKAQVTVDKKLDEFAQTFVEGEEPA